MNSIVLKIVPPKTHPISGDVLFCKKTFAKLDGVTIHDADMDMGIKGLLFFGISNYMNQEFFDHVYLYEIQYTSMVEVGDWIMKDEIPTLLTNENIMLVGFYNHKIIKTNDYDIIKHNDENDLEDLEFSSKEIIDFMNKYNDEKLELYI